MYILKRRMILVLTAVLSAVFAISCAEQKIDPSIGFPFESYEAWIKKYDPVAVKQASGIYIRFVERQSNWQELPAPVLGTSWLSMNYTGRAFSHDVFETRDSLLTRRLGTWAATTHFVPDFLQFALGQKLCQGMVDALSLMREGDSARVYIPSNIGYTSTMSVNAGYSNSITYANYPVYFDIRLCKIVENPYENELVEVKAKALALGFDLVKDSVEKGLYMRIIKSNPKGDTITKDSTLKIWHSSYFFDSQLQATNVDSIARLAGYYSSTEKYLASEMNPNIFMATSGKDLVYPKVVLKMRSGETAEVIATSWMGAGLAGNLAAKPQLLPYQSLRYVITTIPRTTDSTSTNTAVHKIVD